MAITGTPAFGGGGGGGTPGGTGTQLQDRVDATTFGGVAGTAVAAGGAITATASGDTITPVTIAGHSATQSAPVTIFKNSTTDTPTAAFEFMGVGIGDIGDGTKVLSRFAAENSNDINIGLTNKAAPAGTYSAFTISAAGLFNVYASVAPDDLVFPGFTLDTVSGDVAFSPGDGNSQSFIVQSAGSIFVKPVAFSALPVSPLTIGMIACISDSVLATWGAVIVGGGGNKVLGFYNGSNWTVFAA